MSLASVLGDAKDPVEGAWTKTTVTTLLVTIAALVAVTAGGTGEVIPSEVCVYDIKGTSQTRTGGSGFTWRTIDSVTSWLGSEQIPLVPDRDRGEWWGELVTATGEFWAVGSGSRPPTVPVSDGLVNLPSCLLVVDTSAVSVSRAFYNMPLGLSP